MQGTMSLKFICSLLNDISINPDSKPFALNEWKSENGELEGARQEVWVAYFKILSSYLLEWTA